MRTVEHGWIQGWPSPALLSWARERQERDDSAKPNTMPNIASAEKRARGYVAEHFLAAWLRARGVTFVQNGGPDARPDFEIAKRRVGVRLVACQRRWLPSYFIYVFNRHSHTVDTWFFCATEMDTDRYLLLGAIDRQEFLAKARFLPASAELCRGFVAEEDLWVGTTEMLTAPEEWLDATAA